MPPPRRHARTTTPPVRRRRVAGMRRSETGIRKPPADPTVDPVVEPDTLAEPEPELESELEPADLETDAAPVLREPEVLDEPVVSGPVIGEDRETEPDDNADDAEPVRVRPSGKRRTAGITVPDDLAEAEAEVAEPHRARRRTSPLGLAIVLAVLALMIGGLAAVFNGQSRRAAEGADTNNKALIDPAAQSELVSQVRTAIEKTLSYNYTDLDSTAKAVSDNITGKALCEYDQLFGEVRKLAPEQKIVLTTQVREIGVTRLEGDSALLLVFVDQQTTRADQNQTTASGAQFGVRAQRQENTWRITEFQMLGQPLPNGKPAPTC